MNANSSFDHLKGQGLVAEITLAIIGGYLLFLYLEIVGVEI